MQFPEEPPSWKTVTVCPATVIVPLRLDEGLTATEYVTIAIALPEPLPPEVTLIQDALLVAFQLLTHPEGDPATVIEPTPPDIGIDADVGDTE